ncbi:hypothetical protein ABZ733_06715 [Streptomyces longwoodensis]|uniref:hypothetical protein n=1 Tax=Streptomyces longwoodensis TaxID=68231 RepID=UPI0033EA71F2
MSGLRFSLAEAERRLGPAAIAAARRSVESAPPMRTELREQIRAVFASARTTRPTPAAADAA